MPIFRWFLATGVHTTVKTPPHFWRKSLVHSIFTTSIALCLAVHVSTHAETIIVPPGGDIQAAIDEIDPGDTIELQAGVYNPTSTLDPQGKRFTLIGAVNENGEPTSIIDGQSSIRVLQCMNNEGMHIKFENLVIRNGYAEEGGGLYCYDTGPTITNCTFMQNTAQRGGGMYIYWASPVLTDCRFISNVGEEEGGGFYAKYNCMPTLNNCSFIDNVADVGGGFRDFDYCYPMLNDCIFVRFINVIFSFS